MLRTAWATGLSALLASVVIDQPPTDPQKVAPSPVEGPQEFEVIFADTSKVRVVMLDPSITIGRCRSNSRSSS